jgi:hypothetical protein
MPCGSPRCSSGDATESTAIPTSPSLGLAIQILPLLRIERGQRTFDGRVDLRVGMMRRIEDRTATPMRMIPLASAIVWS